MLFSKKIFCLNICKTVPLAIIYTHISVPSIQQNYEFIKEKDIAKVIGDLPVFYTVSGNDLFK